MAHARTAIRSALVVALTGLSTTGVNVFPNRAYPKGDGNLPCLLVLTNDESEIGEDFNGNSTLERQLELQVRCVAKESDEAGDKLDDKLDAMIAEVEVAMNSAGTLGGKVKDISAPKSIRVGLDDSLDQPVGIAEVNFVVTYSTKAGTPGTPL